MAENNVDNTKIEEDVSAENNDTTVKANDGNNNSQKASKKKKKESYFSLGALRRQVEAYGFKYSIKDFFKQLLFVYAILGFAAYMYKLKIPCYIVLALAGALLAPAMVKAQFRFLYEQQKFADVGDYLEQMIYSFMKRPKIREALLDTSQLLESRKIKEKVDKAIEFIDSSDSENLYEDAFAIIEEEYGCDKMKNLHEFLVKVESEGGEYDSSIHVLLQDVQAWVERTYVYQNKRNGVKGKIILAIGMALFMCGILTHFIPDEFSITGRVTYQVVSLVFLILMAIIYTVSQTKLTGSWLDNGGIRSDKEIIKDYRYYTYFDYKRELMGNLVFVVIFLIIAAVCFFLIPKAKNMSYCFLIISFAYATMPKRKYKLAKKRLESDIQKVFPSWLRDVAISLQTSTVQVAIINSFDKAPTVLKPAIQQLINEFQEDPDDIGPWNNFLKDYDVPQLKSATKMFYSINHLGKEDAEKQINSLIERNNILVQKGDELRAEDALSMVGYVVAIPMLISMIKLLVDMFLMIQEFLGIMNTINISL